MFGALGLLGAVLDNAICEETPRIYRRRPSYDLDDFLYDLDREAEIERLRREKRELEIELENFEYLSKEERRKAIKKAQKKKMKKEIEEAKERLNKMLRELD